MDDVPWSAPSPNPIPAACAARPRRESACRIGSAKVIPHAQPISTVMAMSQLPAPFFATPIIMRPGVASMCAF